ncbi:hypothetical protein [Affinibrenneria salicis]|uniref:hypothetical protein n=1 Tax=Affinibrenneria salicis TaxID=2590031 RepID=UPI00168B4D14|nr:hypothetical protein [Affinibrenneria salicis]
MCWPAVAGCWATWCWPERARRGLPPAPYYASTLTEQDISRRYTLARRCRLPGDVVLA